MTKEAIVQMMYERTEFGSKAATERILEAILEASREILAEGEEVHLRGFGSLVVVRRAARKGRDFKTGEPIEIPAASSVKFLPGKGLKETISGNGGPAGLEHRLEALKTTLDEYRGKVGDFGGEARETLRKTLDRVGASYEEARYKLTLLKGGAEGAWEEVKHGVEEALDDLKSAFDRASSKF